MSDLQNAAMQIPVSSMAVIVPMSRKNSMSCVGVNGSVFSKKTGDTFLHVNKSKIAWKILIANQNF